VRIRPDMSVTFLDIESGPVARLDYALVRRGLLFGGLILQFFTPMARDPVEFGVGAMAPWVLVSIVGSPLMPASIAYFLLWQWLEVFARAVLTFFDGESMFDGIYGPTVGFAYWYMLAGLVAMAVAFRVTLSGLREPSTRLRFAHCEWRANDLFACYLVTLVIAAGYGYGTNALPSLDQQMEAVARLKVVALFLLFANVLSTRRGWRFLAMAVAFEILSGFSGLFSDFKSVFIVLMMAAMAIRVRWTNSLALASAVLACVAVGLALFWTAVKSDFRQYATDSEESQNIKASLADRYSYLGSKAADMGSIDLESASYKLVYRLAYVDIFGSVIAVSEVNVPESYPRQWTDALEHILKPRFLFPEKPGLSDTETFARLALGNALEDMRAGTSISVGYISENFVDFGFPGMLASLFALVAVIGLMCRYFMMAPLPWLMREGIVLALIYTCANTGVEMSLPKLLGAAVMFFIVYIVLVRYMMPAVWRWLDDRTALGLAHTS
jgi:hypothetical protein